MAWIHILLLNLKMISADNFVQEQETTLVKS